MKPNYLQYQSVRYCSSSGSNFMREQTDLFLLVYSLCLWAVLSGRAGSVLCTGLSFVCPELSLPPSYTTALEVTLKILISGCFYGRWKRIWVRLKQLIISSFAVDNIWINFRLNWRMELILSRLRRGWWDVLTLVVLAADLALGTGAAEVAVCSSFTWVTVSSVPQSSPEHCSVSDHAVLAFSEQSLTVTWHFFSLPEPGIVSVSSTCYLKEEKTIYFANQV